jgi:pimeloyl-ACP methyl ester carboxylesterase
VGRPAGIEARAKQRRMIIGGLGDRLAPPEQAKALWEHWGRPRLHWYPGNHMLHVRRGVYLKEMEEFMSVNDF